MKKAQELTPKQIARYEALPQEEKDKFCKRVGADMEREVQEDKKADKIEADKLTKAYNDDPELWRSMNLARKAVESLIGTLLPDAPSSQANVMANYDGRVRELSRPQDTALELALVEQLAASLVRLQMVSIQCPLNVTSIKVNDYMDRHLEAAQRRVDRDCLTLAKVRRLALPILLLNYAERQQINVGLVSKAPKPKR